VLQTCSRNNVYLLISKASFHLHNISSVFLACCNCVADKLDEDYLYNWYRTLYQLFSKAGFHLFHTSSHDSLCLQVTLMQSCVYFLSFVRNPGSHAYTMHPPADHGLHRVHYRVFVSVSMYPSQFYLHTHTFICKCYEPYLPL